ncbi:hypothetical protein FIBSPDRAFT_951456 [Athelia psychrophila]|uniref:Glutaredoxin domain-containing protein n=1 Tax=Athelia psychrophila TaxID=1759441 RepID=A0A166MNJ5_9AGAM|nr:hypothetical protein FIBSPDRAFT_951456 [Fibularhizoctonia sp. CBS 109695]
MSSEPANIVNHTIYSSQIVLFTQPDCTYCDRAIVETSWHNYPGVSREVFELEEGEPDTAEIQEYLQEKYGQSAVPYVFISESTSPSAFACACEADIEDPESDREFIGGSDALHSMHEAGRLHEMLLGT